MKNLFFLCGPHGCGKTTLAKELEKENQSILNPELYMRTIKFETNPIERLALKICQRSIENYEYREIAKKNPEKIVLGNRCIYDQFAYNGVYFSKNWISYKEYTKYNTISEISFVKELQEPYAIILNPGFEVVKKHLEKRWGEKGKKWKEEDLEYAKLACDAYDRIRYVKERSKTGKEKILYIDREIDLESREDIKKVDKWLRRTSGLQNVLNADLNNENELVLIGGKA